MLGRTVVGEVSFAAGQPKPAASKPYPPEGGGFPAAPCAGQSWSPAAAGAAAAAVALLIPLRPRLLRSTLRTGALGKTRCPKPRPWEEPNPPVSKAAT